MIWLSSTFSAFKPFITSSLDKINSTRNRLSELTKNCAHKISESTKQQAHRLSASTQHYTNRLSTSTKHYSNSISQSTKDRAHRLSTSTKHYANQLSTSTKHYAQRFNDSTKHYANRLNDSGKHYATQFQTQAKQLAHYYQVKSGNVAYQQREQIIAKMLPAATRAKLSAWLHSVLKIATYDEKNFANALNNQLPKIKKFGKPEAIARLLTELHTQMLIHGTEKTRQQRELLTTHFKTLVGRDFTLPENAIETAIDEKLIAPQFISELVQEGLKQRRATALMAAVTVASVTPAIAWALRNPAATPASSNVLPPTTSDNTQTTNSPIVNNNLIALETEVPVKTPATILPESTLSSNTNPGEFPAIPQTTLEPIDANPIINIDSDANSANTDPVVTLEENSQNSGPNTLYNFYQPLFVTPKEPTLTVEENHAETDVHVDVQAPEPMSAVTKEEASKTQETSANQQAQDPISSSNEETNSEVVNVGVSSKDAATEEIPSTFTSTSHVDSHTSLLSTMSSSVADFFTKTTTDAESKAESPTSASTNANAVDNAPNVAGDKFQTQKNVFDPTRSQDPVVVQALMEATKSIASSSSSLPEDPNVNASTTSIAVEHSKIIDSLRSKAQTILITAAALTALSGAYIYRMRMANWLRHTKQLLEKKLAELRMSRSQQQKALKRTNTANHIRTKSQGTALSGGNTNTSPTSTHTSVPSNVSTTNNGSRSLRGTTSSSSSSSTPSATSPENPPASTIENPDNSATPPQSSAGHRRKGTSLSNSSSHRKTPSRSSNSTSNAPAGNPEASSSSSKQENTDNAENSSKTTIPDAPGDVPSLGTSRASPSNEHKGAANTSVSDLTNKKAKLQATKARVLKARKKGNETITREQVTKKFASVHRDNDQNDDDNNAHDNNDDDDFGPDRSINTASKKTSERSNLTSRSSTPVISNSSVKPAKKPAIVISTSAPSESKMSLQEQLAQAKLKKTPTIDIPTDVPTTEEPSTPIEVLRNRLSAKLPTQVSGSASADNDEGW